MKKKEESGERFSPDMVDERTEAKIEMLHAQFSALTEMMVHLIQSNSTEDFTEANTLETRREPIPLFTGAPGISSRFITVATLTTAGYSPDTHALPFSNTDSSSNGSEKKSRISSQS